METYVAPPGASPAWEIDRAAAELRNCTNESQIRAILQRLRATLGRSENEGQHARATTESVIRRTTLCFLLREVAPQWLDLLSQESRDQLMWFFVAEENCSDPATFLALVDTLRHSRMQTDQVTPSPGSLSPGDSRTRGIEISSSPTSVRAATAPDSPTNAARPGPSAFDRAAAASLAADILFQLICSQQAVNAALQAVGKPQLAALTQALVTAPDYAFASLGRETPRDMSPDTYFRHLARNILVDDSKTLEPSRRASVVSKLWRTGRGQIVAEEWVTCFASGKPASTTALDLVKFFDSRDRERILLSLIRVLPVPTRINVFAQLFDAFLPADLIDTPGVLQRLATAKFFVSKPFPREALWAMQRHLHFNSQDLFLQAATHTARVWSNPSFAAGTDRELHRYVTGALLCFLDALSRQDIEQTGVMTLIVTGMQHYLGSSMAHVRVLGMIIGESLARSLDPSNPVSFGDLQGERDFEYDPRQSDLPNGLCGPINPEESPANSESAAQSLFMAEEVRCIDSGSATLAEAGEKSEPEEKVVSFLGLALRQGKGQTAGTSRHRVDDDDDDNDDDDDEEEADDGDVERSSPSTLPEKHKANEKRVSVYDRSVWSDESDSEGADSDDESDTEEVLPKMGGLDDNLDAVENDPKYRLPAYLGDCIAMLQSDKDFRLVESALAGLPDLIDTCPADLSIAGLNLARATLHLENRFALEGFAPRRIKILAALAASPVNLQVVGMLCEEALTKNGFTTIRLDALDALVAGARRLADDGPQVGEPERPDHAESQQVVGKVIRRWGQRRNPAPVSRTNRFAGVAPEFILPLLISNSSTQALFAREPMVLARLLFTVGALLGLSKNSVHADRLARSALDILWWARFNSEAQVRRAVLFVFVQVLMVVPRALLSEPRWLDTLAELQSWAESVQGTDPDDGCRAQGGAIAEMLGGRTKRLG